MDLRQALLGKAIDYAGLFPPAALPMAAAVREYVEHRASADGWALARFVVPAGRVPDLTRALTAIGGEPGPPMPVALVGGPEVADILPRLVAAVAEAGGRVEALELRAPGPADAGAALRQVPVGLDRYLEIPLDGDPEPWLGVARQHGAAAKFRTGGVEEAAIPSPAALLAAVRAAIRSGVPFKCTAGLHHPVRGEYPLTYAPDSPTAVLHGYLNVWLAAAALLAGWEADAPAILEETDPASFDVTAGRLAWRHREFTPDLVAALRSRGMRGFGSCSFREPVDELAALAAA